MEKWEYKIKTLSTNCAAFSGKVVTFMTTKKMEVEKIFGGKKTAEMPIPLTEKEMENDFNNLGEEGWELCGTVPVVKVEMANPGGSNTKKVYFIFKRQIKN